VRNDANGLFLPRCSSTFESVGIAAAGSLTRRRVRREVADIEHRTQQCGLGQDRLRIRKHVCGRVLAASETVEQRLDLGHALADCPHRITGHPLLHQPWHQVDMPTVAAASRARHSGAKRAGVSAPAVILQGPVGVILTHPARVVAKIARHVSVLGAELRVFWQIHRGIPHSCTARNPDRGDGARGARLVRGSNAPAVAICVGNLATDLWRPRLREPFALNRRGLPWRPRNVLQYLPRHAGQLGNVHRDWKSGRDKSGVSRRPSHPRPADEGQALLATMFRSRSIPNTLIIAHDTMPSPRPLRLPSPKRFYTTKTQSDTSRLPITALRKAMTVRS
jgi:hypothetical protein